MLRKKSFVLFIEGAKKKKNNKSKEETEKQQIKIQFVQLWSKRNILVLQKSFDIYLFNFQKKIPKNKKCIFKDFLSFDEINIECNQVDYKQICLLVLCCYANWLEFRLALLWSSFKHNVYWKSFETRKFKVCWSVSVDLTG